ncbi:hypothetical protein A6U87_14660 [Rhizobium sp. AC44/96]|uniref:gene transfer agent family protein n=1 Tax=Rhizobium sp. AC44/96 TaxID=1841654 RepID=UPI00080F7907|nr:gene transfer agent family protein [Rhizobium sp. AC44/96]OCJ05247.1 hypothetical protein A6U87_14660 [Rhizobium sp. AC44/96]
MHEAVTHTAFFGDQQRDFVLTAPMVLELERVTGSGIGSIIKRVIARDYTASEITQTIRLALIGGGTSPEDADALIRAYVHPRPLAEAYSLALEILEVRMLVKSLDANASDLQIIAQTEGAEDAAE